MLYLGTAIAFLDSTTTTVIRSLITKIIHPDEVGRVFSVVAIFIAILPFIGSPMFGLLYKNTVATQPNAFIFLITGIKGLVFLVVLCVYIQMKKSISSESTEEGFVQPESKKDISGANDQQENF